MAGVQDTSTSVGLRIGVVGSVGRGPTALAAFDDCLSGAGASNLNLIRLSSVIPPGSLVQSCSSHDNDVVDLRQGVSSSRRDWGDRLYAVWAFQGAQLLGEEAWAGVAWVQHPEDGRGLFVEHEGGSEVQVRQELEATLSFMCRSRGFDDLEQRSVVIGTRCEGEPVGALVLAPYRVTAWFTDESQ